MKQYKRLVKKILTQGERRTDRTGVGTLSLFGEEMRFDLTKGFPLLTLKKTHFKYAVVELLWMLSGDTNTEFLEKNGVTFWREWQDDKGDLGRIYGAQWRNFRGISNGALIFKDQISELVESLKNNPDSRRHIVTAWNPCELDEMALPPCHCFFQCYVSSDNELSLKLTQRSQDTFLGAPYNIVFYALLIEILAQQTGLVPNELIISIGDAHLYMNHIKQAKKMISRTEYDLPKVKINKAESIFDYKVSDFEIIGYKCHPTLKGDVAI